MLSGGRRPGVLPTVLLAAALAVAPATPARSAGAVAAPAVTVTDCPIPASELAGITVTPAPVPARWASPVPLPAAVTVYGTGVPGGAVVYTAGPAGAQCEAAFASADGGLVVSIAAAGSGKPELGSVFSPGGAGPATDLACSYIPAVHRVDVAFRQGDYCARPPSGDTLTQVATGDSSFAAAIVVTAPGATDPQLRTSGVAGESTVAVFLARLYGSSQAAGQMAECTLPTAARSACVAALQLFAAQSVLTASRTAAGAVLAALAALAAPSGSGGRIVVIGDSYASGEGTYNNGSDPTIPSADYYPQTATASDHCHRSPQAYAVLLGVAASDFVACSGATTYDIAHGRDGEPPQLSVLTRGVTTVILSAGGDDLGFATVLTDCTDVPFFAAHSYTDCANAVSTARGKMPATIANLRRLYATIESRTGGARLVVVGYPRLFPAGGHFGCNWIDEPRQLLLNKAADDFDEQIKSAVGSVQHATFVDTRSLFTGHEVCGATSTPYINDLQTDLGLAHNCPQDYLAGPACSQSYHPDVPAYRAEADLLHTVLHGGAAAPPGPPSPATGSAPRADCYDIDYQGLDSRPMAQYCAATLSSAGFTATAHSDATGTAELAASAQDAVFYASGHSAADCPGEWNADGTQIVNQKEATGASILATGDGTAFLAGPRDIGAGGDANCFPGSSPSQVLSSWATAPVIGHADLVVLQACETVKPTFTATDGTQLVSVGQEAFDAGAKTVVGFTDEVQFQGAYGQYGYEYGIPSPYRPTGDIWAHTFWAALGADVPLDYAVEDATAQETLYSGGDGYLSWTILSHDNAPATLSQIRAAGP